MLVQNSEAGIVPPFDMSVGDDGNTALDVIRRRDPSNDPQGPQFGRFLTNDVILRRNQQRLQDDGKRSD